MPAVAAKPATAADMLDVFERANMMQAGRAGSGIPDDATLDSMDLAALFRLVNQYRLPATCLCGERAAREGLRKHREQHQQAVVEEAPQAEWEDGKHKEEQQSGEIACEEQAQRSHSL